MTVAPPTLRLLELDELPRDGVRGLSTAHGELIVVRVDGHPAVYENRCPHRGVTLDWAPGRLLSADGRYLQCATHGALFELDGGLCVSGPCQGRRLTRCRSRVEAGALWLEAREEGAPS